MRNLPTVIVVVVLLVPLARDASADDAEVFYVTSTLSSGPGSIREAIDAANATPRQSRIVSRLEPGAIVYVFRELPALRAYGLELDGDGMTLKGETCRRADGREGCSGIVIGGPRIRVRRLKTTAFLFDGIAVRDGAVDARIEDCHAFANLDDGIGISAGATGVVVENCILERNGYRTKGKGVLVFDYAQALLRGNTIRYNRDGVTVSRGARATLERNTIVENYDKGLGITGGEAAGVGNSILRNGLNGPDGQPGPNADGLRVTSDGDVRLRETIIEGNGDCGVVAADGSVLELVGGAIRENRGFGVHVVDQAAIELRDLELRANGRGAFRVEGQGKLVRLGVSEDSAAEGGVGDEPSSKDKDVGDEDGDLDDGKDEVD
jgi:parallel beta-helix repeat protein